MIRFWKVLVIALSENVFLRTVVHGLAVGAVLAVMALMAFAAGLALLGAMIILPVVTGLVAMRQGLRNGSGAAAAGTGWLALHWRGHDSHPAWVGKQF